MSWPVVKLGNVVESIMGQAPPGVECNKTGEGTIFVKAGEFGKEFPVIKEWTTKPLRYAKKGDTLLCVVGATCGKVNKAIDCAIGRSVAAIRPIKDKIDENYLFYFVSSWSSKLRNMSQGAAQTVINKDMIANLEIPLPPLDEQKRIAAILDKADAIRRKRQQAIQLADDFLRSVFLDMFGDPVTNPKGWELRSLASLCRKITDGTHHSPPIVEKGFPYVTAKHLKKTGLEFHAKPWYVSEEEHKKIFSRCNPEKNDVLYIKDGATTGLAAINEYDFEFSMLSSLALLKPNFELVNSEFLCMFLNHPRTKLVLTANMAGAAITRLTLAKIKDVKVPLPDINTQEKFKEVYISVRAILNKVKASDGLSEQEFNSLSQKAFAGEL
ncbi:restriction endonuclease subunit S [Pseudoalteromonas sp. Angola-31]|nr:restriction endonuclease subunit S [Pseudoalteromonas sp. Angola-31]